MFPRRVSLEVVAQGLIRPEPKDGSRHQGLRDNLGVREKAWRAERRLCQGKAYLGGLA